jgi:hypothetical protein
MLSVLRFLLSCCTYNKRPVTSLQRHSLRCDNKSMVNKVNEVSNYENVYPNTTFDAEWDVIAQIVASVEELRPTSPKIRHIFGHQDKDKEYSELSLPAQLNCDADALAGQFLLQHDNLQHVTAHIFPAGGCLLQSRDGTISHDHKKQLQLARTEPPLRQRLCHRFAWADATFDDVAWTCHGCALRRHLKHKTTFVKYLHDWLPLGKQAHRYDKKYPASCPSCAAPVEDRDHFWSCPASSRLQWKQSFIHSMRVYLRDVGTAPDIQTQLIDALRIVLFSASTTGIIVQPGLRDVATAQQTIGWHQLLRGRFSKQWIKAQDQYLGTNATTQNNGTQWLTNVIDFIFTQWWTLWELRNEDRHGRDLVTQSQAHARQAIYELTQLYDDYQHTVPDRLGWLFSTSLQTRMQWPTNALRLWINTWKPILQESYTTALETG